MSLCLSTYCSFGFRTEPQRQRAINTSQLDYVALLKQVLQPLLLYETPNILSNEGISPEVLEYVALLEQVL